MNRPAPCFVCFGVIAQVLRKRPMVNAEWAVRGEPRAAVASGAESDSPPGI